MLRSADRSRPWWVWPCAAVVAIILIAGMAIVVTAFFPRHLGARQDRQPSIETPTGHVGANALTTTRNRFGPWHTVANQTIPDNREVVVMLMNNGSKQVGSKPIRIKRWEPAVLVDFRNVEARHKRVLVKTTSGTVYVFALDEPFVESRPQTVYSFNGKSRLVTAPIPKIHH